MTEPTYDERAEFEAGLLRITNEIVPGPLDLSINHDNGEYENGFMEIAWRTWQAARRTPTPVGVEPFGIWHEGETEDESDFFLFKDSGDVACPTCIKLYTADQALAMVRVPLTEEQMRTMRKKHPAEDTCGWSYELGIKDAEQHHGIKGGQHGTDT